jgi:hypothetical protein
MCVEILNLCANFEEKGDQKREKVRAKTIFKCRWEEQVDGGQD